MSNELEKATAYLNDTPRFARKSTLPDIQRYLERFGNPHEGMKIVHVAGTNGKGSVSAFIASCLREAGFSVGLFTSPHLTDIRERMTFNGEMISEEEFLEYFDLVRAECTEAERDGLPHPLYFEFLFLMAMLWFHKKSPDYLVLETGLGGRLDATNAIPDKEIAVITRIGLDHMAYLGDTIASVAGEKAGILRKNTPAVFLRDPDEAFQVIRAKAEEVGAEAVVVDPSMWEVHAMDDNGIDFSVYNRYDKTLRARLPLLALYQCENAALAVTACRILLGDTGRKSSPQVDSVLEKGLSAMVWPGRMEQILPSVYLDGAHNPDGMRAFLESVRQIFAQDGLHRGEVRRFLLFSCVRDKMYREELRMIRESGLFTDIAAVPMEGARALSAQELREEIGRNAGGIRFHQMDNVEDAVNRLILNRDVDMEVFAVGSLYLIGEIRGLINKKAADGQPVRR